ncbi:hypothetical protein B33_29080 [Bacillus safensis]|nr:hypothetical protein B33_29080 [Bacillus safensis]
MLLLLFLKKKSECKKGQISFLVDIIERIDDLSKGANEMKKEQLQAFCLSLKGTTHDY